MKPPDFDYFVPDTAEETLSLLKDCGEQAKILAGGQSLIPILNFRLFEPRVLIDINHVRELSYIHESDGGLRIGALTRHRMLENSPTVQRKWPLLVEAARMIGYPAIRNRGTCGGSLAHADPAAELPLALKVLEGRILVRSAEGENTITAENFFIGPLSTAIEPTQLLVEAWVPAIPKHTGWGFHELTLQHNAFAIVAAAALITLDDNGRCLDLRLGLGNAGPVPFRAQRSEDLLRGEKVNEASIGEAARLAAQAAECRGDVHASAGYRTSMAEVLARRAMLDALARAGEANG
jgi:CO/xanthine dehydrogenase FAD-binding subunit